tara:strand:+ start:497 stop:1375 length:879 start_codon:yes stop_codon:yes gene_type:complete
MNKYLISKKFSVPPPNSKVLVNSVTRNGVHLVGSVLDIIGMKTSTYGYIKRKKVQLNSRTSQHPSNYFVRWSNKKIPISIGSPRMVRLKLVERICSKVKDNEYMLSHIPYSAGMDEILRDLKWKNIVILRDPRDQCASMLHKLKIKKNNPASHYLYENLKTDSDRIKAIIDGYDGLDNIRGMVGLEKMYRSVLDWKGKGNFIFIKFEDLIGPKGGGNFNSQKETIIKILKHLNYKHYDNDEIVEWIGYHCFGTTNSFWKGQIGNWKNVFDKEIVKIFENNISGLLDQLDYKI